MPMSMPNQNQMMEYVDEFFSWEPHIDLFNQSLTVDALEYYHLSYSRFFISNSRDRQDNFVSLLDESSIYFLDLLALSLSAENVNSQNLFANIYSIMQFYIRKCWMLEVVKTTFDLPYRNFFHSLDPATLCLCIVFQCNQHYCTFSRQFSFIRNGTLDQTPPIFGNALGIDYSS